MSSFKDALGREWSFSITVIEVKRLRELIQVDLLDFASEKADQMFNRLATDPVLLVDLMSILLTDQIQDRGLDERLSVAGGAVQDSIAAITSLTQVRARLERPRSQTNSWPRRTVSSRTRPCQRFGSL